MNLWKDRIQLFSILLVLINYIELKEYPACDDMNNLCVDKKNCLCRAREPAYLICGVHPVFFKQPDITVGPEFSDDYNYTLCIDNKIPMKLLSINSVQSTDVGFNSYWADKEFFDENCTFNIFAWDDIMQVDIWFHDSTADTVTIKSFKDSIPYSVQVEALPLNEIVINNEIVNSTPCVNSTNYPWLNCLKNDDLSINAKHCENQAAVNVTYRFENEDQYSVLNLVTKYYHQTIKVRYPPQVINKTIEKDYFKSDTKTNLVCSIACSNPEPIEYAWYFKDKRLIKKGKDPNLTFEIKEPESGKDIEIFCEANNDLESSDEMNRIDFKLKFKETPTTRTSGLESWEILLIVVSIIVFVLVVIGSILTACLIIRSRKGNSKKNLNEQTQSNINMNTGVNGRKNELDNELTDNPIYGSRQSVLTSHSL